MQFKELDSESSYSKIFETTSGYPIAIKTFEMNLIRTLTAFKNWGYHDILLVTSDTREIKQVSEIFWKQKNKNPKDYPIPSLSLSKQECNDFRSLNIQFITVPSHLFNHKKMKALKVFDF